MKVMSLEEINLWSKLSLQSNTRHKQRIRKVPCILSQYPSFSRSWWKKKFGLLEIMYIHNYNVQSRHFDTTLNSKTSTQCIKHSKYKELHQETYLFQEFRMLSKVSSLVHIYKKEVSFAHVSLKSLHNCFILNLNEEHL